jgi:urocanate hydratase
VPVSEWKINSKAQAEEKPMTVWIYVNTSKSVGDREHLTVFASAEAAFAWIELNDPEGVAFSYTVRGVVMTCIDAHDRFDRRVSDILKRLKRS